MQFYKQCIPLVFVITFPLTILSQIVLTEVMFDTKGSEYTDEFVEIFNTSKTKSVDLTNWLIGDGSGEDLIIDTGEGTVILPEQYGIILDGDYISKSTYYDSLIPPEALILTIDGTTIGSGGLSNTRAETVMLINNLGNVVAQYTYSTGNLPGYSDEKINIYGTDNPENWSDSNILNGTPGFRNSVAIIQFDLKTTRLWSEPENPGEGEDVVIRALIINTGREPVSEFSVIFFNDIDGDSTADSEEIIESVSIEWIDIGDSTEVSVIWTKPEPGIKSIGIWIDFTSDERQEDNLLLGDINIGFSQNTLIINEIMYDPIINQPEWIELYNPGKDKVDLKEWKISDDDTSKKVQVTYKKSVVFPSEYVVVSDDSSVLDQYPPWNGFLFTPEQFPNLNNDFDSIVLFDPIGSIIDKVDYKKSWGGGDGISIERISPEILSIDSTNWNSCVSIENATPGMKNSIYTSVLPTSAILSVSPNPFSPDGDGLDDAVVISYNVPMKTSTVNLRIYDVRGRRIRNLLSSSASGSEGFTIWNGNDDEGRLAHIGIYIVYLEGLNSSEGVVVSAKTTVVLADKL